MEIIYILLIALVIDLIFGEPGNMLHPVAWLGKLTFLEMKLAPEKGRLFQLVYGVSIVLITLGAITALTFFLVLYLQDVSSLIYVVVAGILLKFTFSFRGLIQAVTAVKGLLSQDNLNEARICSRALVSRDTADLDENQLVSAAVESVAENSCDSFVAPLFYFMLFGIPGAVAYRVINTFDAMIGYHGELEYLGKFAARLDDVVNFIPARITALLIVMAAWICRKNVSQAWHIMIRDHKKTKSPNAGWTMSAIAGALGIRLEKTGHYQLGDAHYSLSLDTMNAAVRVIVMASVVWSCLFVIAEVVYFVAT